MILLLGDRVVVFGVGDACDASGDLSLVLAGVGNIHGFLAGGGILTPCVGIKCIVFSGLAALRLSGVQFSLKILVQFESVFSSCSAGEGICGIGIDTRAPLSVESSRVTGFVSGEVVISGVDTRGTTGRIFLCQTPLGSRFTVTDTPPLVDENFLSYELEYSSTITGILSHFPAASRR